MQRRTFLRVGLIVALLTALTLIAVTVIAPRGRGYELTARFPDAGQLVKGGTVQLAGETVGTIEDIRLADDGVAEVVMGIDDAVAPLRRGTTAQIRSLGLSGVANRFVSLQPGPDSGAPIDDGGRLELAETQGIVDLDAVLTSLDPGTREKLKGLLASGGRLGEGDTPADANRALKYLNPAVAEGRALARELTRDREALGSLISTGAETARVVAAHDDALGRGLAGTATTLRALAQERGTLDRLLVRAPAASRRIGRSLDSIGRTFDGVRPAFADLSGAAPALAGLARELPPASQTLRPVLADLRGTLPDLNTTLRKAPALSAAATPAFASATSAVRRLQPILTGLRPYAPDLVAGIFLGFGGTAGASYDANGHVGRIGLTTIGAGAAGVGSLVSPGGALGPLTPTTAFTKRCPGAGAQLAPDGSNAPAQQPECDPGQRRP